MYYDDDEEADESSVPSGAKDSPGPDDSSESPDEDSGAGMYDNADSSFVTDDGDDGEESSEGSQGKKSGLEMPLSSDDDGPEQATGTFYVKHTEDVSATLHEVDTGQIFTLIQHPELERHEIIEASLIAQPPMEVSYLIETLESRRTVPVERSSQTPTQQVQKAGTRMDAGEAVAIPREGEGEIHILSVEPDRTDRTAEEVLDDEMTYKNAARYDIDRVEVRSDADQGLVSIRYLPD